MEARGYILTVWFSDEYTQLYPYAPNPANEAMTIMKTAEQISAENIVTMLVKIDYSFTLTLE